MATVTRYLTKILQVACVVLFTALVIIVVWQVFARQVLRQPQAWTEEASRMTFVWLGLFAAALVFSERGHIAVDFIVRRLGPGAQKTVAILVQVLIIVFALALFVWGGIIAGEGAANQRLSALTFLTLGQMYLVLPITGVIIAFFALENIQAIVRGSEPPFPATEEEELVEGLEADGRLPAASGESPGPGGTHRPGDPPQGQPGSDPRKD